MNRIKINVIRNNLNYSNLIVFVMSEEFFRCNWLRLPDPGEVKNLIIEMREEDFAKMINKGA